MKRKYCALLLACVWANSLVAQYEKILADPSVSWAAEIELWLTPEEAQDIWPYDSLNNSTVLKSMNLDGDKPFSRPVSLNDRLVDMMLLNRWQAFMDGDLTHSLNRDECFTRMYPPTPVGLDPNTQEEIMSVFSLCGYPSLHDCPLFRVRQLLYYRAKTGEFGLVTRVIAIAWADGYTPFWLAVPQPRKKERIKLAHPDISWARRLRTKPENSPQLDSLSALKNPGWPVMTVFTEQMRSDASMRVVHPDDWEPLTARQRADLFTLTDSIYDFNAETFRDTIKVQRIQIKVSDLSRLRLTQDWYWDERGQQLIIRLIAVEPLFPFYDEEGNFRYWRALFCRMNE